MKHGNALIIGAGPAGLTAAYELLERTRIQPIVLEMSNEIGGISRTVNYKGNRIDIGGHRFFSKSNRVMEWWLKRMPVEMRHDTKLAITYRRQSRDIDADQDGPNPQVCDNVMLVRKRKSRIFFLRKLFEYPLQISLDTFSKLGALRVVRMGSSYLYAGVFSSRNPLNLEQFFISRFGNEMYQTFFKSYTEKVWGRKCSEISAEWGAQRIKGLSITKAVTHQIKKMFTRNNDLHQKGTETSLIEQFLYPKYGPGQMWEGVAKEIAERGAEIKQDQRVTKIVVKDNKITEIVAKSSSGNESVYRDLGPVFSTMSIKDLVNAMGSAVPENVQHVGSNLPYRDFITVGLLVDRLELSEGPNGAPISDNWIYIQEPDVKVGRLQIFNNWSPYMVSDKSKIWIGLEYFCFEGDDLWNMSDSEIVNTATREMEHLGIIAPKAVADSTVIRVPKAYPAYFGSYDRISEVREFLDKIDNLYLIGRNGMHKYNNQDHSMLTAMVAVDNIVEGKIGKANIWDVNVEQEYHESK